LNDEFPNDELPNDEVPDDELPNEELPNEELPKDELLPDCDCDCPLPNSEPNPPLLSGELELCPFAPRGRLFRLPISCPFGPT
jgi:hypothetical protein